MGAPVDRRLDAPVLAGRRPQLAWQGRGRPRAAFRGSLVSNSEPSVWRWSASVDGEVAREGVNDSKAAAIDALADIVGEIFWP